VAVAAGGLHSCAVLVDGTVRCWGFNVSGELGNGSLQQSNTPVAVSGLSNVVDVITGDAHTCALQLGGLAFCWGRGQEGELGNGGSVNSATPVQVSLSGVVSLAAGTKSTCAITAGGALSCWGDNTFGQIGDGTTTRRPAPTLVLGVSNMVQAAIGDGYACGVNSRGVAQCWGTNSEGQLGNGTTSPTPLPSTVGGFSGSIGALRIGVSAQFNCAARGTGGVSCWGLGGSGQLGDGQGNGFSFNPVNAQVADTVALVTGGAHSCSVSAAGAVFCWGDNGAGQMGNGVTGGTVKAPRAVASLTNVTALAAGSAYTCALTVDANVACWGANSSGQLGLGFTSTASNVPLALSSLGVGTVRAIATGSNHACALMVDRTLRCWGSNFSGQLGTGAVNGGSSLPVPVAGITNAVAVSAGSSHTCAVLVDGTARCWGSDFFGELGNGIIVNNRPLPDVVTGLTDAISVSAGLSDTCVVRAESSTSCWGHNDKGQLGAADSNDHSAPTPVIQSFVTVRGVTIPQKLAFVTAIGIEGGHACALLATGQPLCWGDNDFGWIGDGTNDPRPRPTVVNSFTANVDPAVTIRSNGRIADVTVLLNCPVGGQAFIQLTLDQGQVEGDGNAAEACAGGMVRVAVTVPAHGPGGFQAGAATAHVEATVRENGHITQDQHWTRAVTLSVEP
jgi:alpha-tubulin suppressor-like RCC1 family protein